jgi:hypothetical protein
MHRRAEVERHAMALGEIRRQPRDRLARLDADFMRALERARERIRAQALAIVPDIARFDDAAFGAHVGGEKRLQHGPRFRAPGDRQKAMLRHGDSRRRRDFHPNIARTARATPAIAGLLARDSDEAEIPDGRSVGLGVAVDHDYSLAEARGRQRVRKPTNAGADDGDVERPLK